MDDGMLSPAMMIDAPADTALDLDYMDELLLDGCWLETTDGSGFLHSCPSNFCATSDPLISWPDMEIDPDLNSNLIPRSSNIEEPMRPPMNELSLSQKKTDDGQKGRSRQSGNYVFEGSELCRRLWIGPGELRAPAISVIERLIMAVGYIKDFVRDKDVLVQVWVPINRGGKSVLTTSNLPFSQNSSCTRLAKYRDISVNYEFTAGDCQKAVGLPGRVFSKRVPEWTPDVRFFKSDEYPRVDYAQQCDVRGTLALPIFEQGSKTCLGVIEVVMVTQQIKYGTELENVCKALEVVKLTSSDVVGYPHMKVFNQSYEAVLLEIRETLRFSCERHRLPLAQTWMSCVQQGRQGCRHSDENYFCCVSTVDRACYVADTRVQDFHEACSEHHLLKGEGIVGLAFMSNEPCFSSDIASFCNTEYPLSHHAKVFDLHAAVAIRLRSVYTSKDDFVLEFFLPVDCRDPEDQKTLLTSLSTIVQQSCRSLRLVTDKECRDENIQPSRRNSHPVTGAPLENQSISPLGEGVCSDGRSSMQEMSKVHHHRLEMNRPTNLSTASSVQNVQQCSGSISLIHEGKTTEVVSSSGYQEFNYNINGVIEDSEECITVGNGSLSNMGRTSEKRRTKVDKTITLQVLRQYFAGSLKDAAKSIGVCPTTLKRICRQHGIKRWPSRKIKKVGHSLQKLQLVIDSVEGASGVFQIGSLYSNFQELASPNLSGTGPLLSSKMGDGLKTSSSPNEVGMSNLQGAASKSPSSSCSQTSSSSQCCSSRSRENPPPWNEAGSEENPCEGELKRVKSEAELHFSSVEGPNAPRRSQSCKSLCKNPTTECLVHSAKETGQVAEEARVLRVKVTFGEEIIRFRVRKRWGYLELLNEIGRRFNLNDMSKFDLKYLDDDFEWVLLTCDADLEECFHVYKSTQVQTIKLSLQVSRHQAKNTFDSNDFS